jgi:hypothetical protein
LPPRPADVTTEARAVGRNGARPLGCHPIPAKGLPFVRSMSKPRLEWLLLFVPVSLA